MENDDDFASGKENYNDVWYNYLVKRKAACFNTLKNYKMQGN
jgi:hypothetical protein